MSEEVAAPSTLTSLTTRIRNIVKDDAEYAQTEIIMGMVVIAQMLPEGAVKGGAGMKIRLGVNTTRFSEDLDIARTKAIEKFQQELVAKLRSGWEGFTGRLTPGAKARPKEVPPEYVMQPFTVALLFNKSEWLTIPLEVTHDELELLDEADSVLSPDILDLFTKVGLPKPRDISVISIRTQLAQKLHALTSGNQNRAHDLVDLQLLVDVDSLDFAEAKKVCIRLFGYRKKQAWPPELIVTEEWERRYSVAARGVDVHQDPIDALAWLKTLVGKIDAT